MADGRRSDAWGRTAAVMALVANTHRDPKRRPRPWSADHFDPYSPRNRGKNRRGGRGGRGVPLKAANVESLARLLVDRRAGK